MSIAARLPRWAKSLLEKAQTKPRDDIDLTIRFSIVFSKNHRSHFVRNITLFFLQSHGRGRGSRGGSNGMRSQSAGRSCGRDGKWAVRWRDSPTALLTVETEGPISCVGNYRSRSRCRGTRHRRRRHAPLRVPVPLRSQGRGRSWRELS